MATKEIIYTADIIESECGWGQRLEMTKEFDTEKERDDFIRGYNDVNLPPLKHGEMGPDIYWLARRGNDIIRDVKPAQPLPLF
jgi:hypothetical protein